MNLNYVQINFWAVLVAAILSMALALLWFSPRLFGKIWMKEIDATEESAKNINIKYLLSFVTTIISAYILAYAMILSDSVTVYEGAEIGFYVWLGFVATTTFSTVLWERRPIILYFIDNIYRLISLILMGGILSVWR